MMHTGTYLGVRTAAFALPPCTAIDTKPREGHPMPTFHIPPDLDLHYLVDNYTDPWRTPGTILLLHGNAEQRRVVCVGAAARAPLSGRAPRHARLRRVDAHAARFSLDPRHSHRRLLPPHGCAGDRALPSGWSQIGGTIARAFAAPSWRVRTLTVVGTPPPYRMGAAERVPPSPRRSSGRASSLGLETTGPSGARFLRGVAWWTTFMGRTAVSTQIGFMRTIACADIRADVPKIACPTLVITTEGSRLATVDDTRAWQQTIPDSELLVLPGDSYHVAASHAVQGAGDPGYRAPGSDEGG